MRKDRKSSKYASFDLHNHTIWSYDADAEIEPYFELARERGIRCLAITEHHNLDGAQEVREVAERYPSVQLITAAELTVHCSIGSVDLVCLGLPVEPEGALAEVLSDYRQWQQDTGAALSRGMVALGFDFSDEKRLEFLRTYRPERVIEVQGATHVKGGYQRRHFIESGFCADVEEYLALMQRVREVSPYPRYPAAEKVVPAVKEAGGVVSIAHPVGYFLTNDRQRMDQARRELDLDAIECAHPSVPYELTAEYRKYCVENGLLSTGGSDSHSMQDQYACVETDKGTLMGFGLHIGEDEWLEELLSELDSRGA